MKLSLCILTAHENGSLSLEERKHVRAAGRGLRGRVGGRRDPTLLQVRSAASRFRTRVGPDPGFVDESEAIPRSADAVDRGSGEFDGFQHLITKRFVLKD